MEITFVIDIALLLLVPGNTGEIMVFIVLFKNLDYIQSFTPFIFHHFCFFILEVHIWPRSLDLLKIVESFNFRSELRGLFGTLNYPLSFLVTYKYQCLKYNSLISELLLILIHFLNTGFTAIHSCRVLVFHKCLFLLFPFSWIFRLCCWRAWYSGLSSQIKISLHKFLDQWRRAVRFRKYIHALIILLLPL
jgi:hypothetical protein